MLFKIKQTYTHKENSAFMPNIIITATKGIRGRKEPINLAVKFSNLPSDFGGFLLVFISSIHIALYRDTNNIEWLSSCLAFIAVTSILVSLIGYLLPVMEKEIDDIQNNFTLINGEICVTHTSTASSSFYSEHLALKLLEEKLEPIFIRYSALFISTLMSATCIMLSNYLSFIS
jgi:hypothetical protein